MGGCCTLTPVSLHFKPTPPIVYFCIGTKLKLLVVNAHFSAVCSKWQPLPLEGAGFNSFAKKKRRFRILEKSAQCAESKATASGRKIESDPSSRVCARVCVSADTSYSRKSYCKEEMGAVASTQTGWLATTSTSVSNPSTVRHLIALARQYGGTSVHLWIRFWIYITGLEKHEELIRRMIAQIKYRKYAAPAHKYSVYHGVLMTLVELWLRTIRVVLVPDVFARYLCATFLLHIFYEMNLQFRRFIVHSYMQLTAKGRKTLRLRKQLDNARTFQERLAIAGELDKVEGKDKWREDPASGLFLYERVMNKTQMYKVSNLRLKVVRARVVF